MISSEKYAPKDILTLKAGGKNEVGNMQTLCEACNKRKQKEDKAATFIYMEAA